MNKTKKFFALVLALMMAFTTLVLPAAAAPEDEGIMPLAEITRCPLCNGSVREGTVETTVSTMTVQRCGKREYNHDHYVYLEETPYYCTSCSYSGTHSRSYMGDCV